jgi:hypothetical protein
LGGPMFGWLVCWLAGGVLDLPDGGFVVIECMVVAQLRQVPHSLGSCDGLPCARLLARMSVGLPIGP